MTDPAEKTVALIKEKIELVNTISNLSIEGAWIVIETTMQDFSLGHLAHLVEQNNARIVNLFSYYDEETDKVLVCFRVDLEDATNVVRSLERFDYTVKFYIQKQRLNDDTLRDRYNELMHYLEM